VFTIRAQRTARLEDVVDGFGDALAIGPLERLAECHQPEDPETELGDVFCKCLDPSDVVDPGLTRAPFALGEHVHIGSSPIASSKDGASSTVRMPGPHPTSSRRREPSRPTSSVSVETSSREYGGRPPA